MITRLPSRIAAAMVLACAGLLVLTASGISAAPSASAATTVVAQIGSRGSAVVIIQRAVHASPDGIYGPKTAAAVTIWQRAHHLTATGVVDSLTWSKMNPVARAASPQLAGNDVSWPQCPKGLGIPSRPHEGKAMPPATAEVVVNGLTNGHGCSTTP